MGFGGDRALCGRSLQMFYGQSVVRRGTGAGNQVLASGVIVKKKKREAAKGKAWENRERIDKKPLSLV